MADKRTLETKLFHEQLDGQKWTGVFKYRWIAAFVADETALNGRKRVTPYRRTLKASGRLYDKYPGGVLASKRRLEAESHRVVSTGRHFFVVDFEKSLAFSPDDTS